MITVNKKIIELTLQEFLDNYEYGLYIKYEHNRGDGRISPKTRNAVRDNFCFAVLGVCHMVKLLEGGLKFADFHSRAQGLYERYKLGHFNSEELINNKINIEVVEETVLHQLGLNFGSYVALINGGDNWKNGNKIICPDFSVAAKIDALYKKYNIQEGKKEIVKPGHRQQLLYIMNYLNNNNTLSYVETVMQKSKASKLLNENSTTGIHLTQGQEQDLALAIHYYIQVVQELKMNFKGVITTDVKSIISSTGFFGYIIVDRLTKRSVTGKTPKRLANKLFMNAGNVRKCTTRLTHGGRQDMVDTISELYKEIR